jgi:hypothetical protein
MLSVVVHGLWRTVKITSFSQVPVAAKAEAQGPDAALALSVEAGLDVAPEPDVVPGLDAVSVPATGQDEAVPRRGWRGEDAGEYHDALAPDAPGDAIPADVNAHLRQQPAAMDAHHARVAFQSAPHRHAHAATGSAAVFGVVPVDGQSPPDRRGHVGRASRVLQSSHSRLTLPAETDTAESRALACRPDNAGGIAPADRSENRDTDADTRDATRHTLHIGSRNYMSSARSDSRHSIH